MKETANRYAIALLSVIMVCLLAVPAMADYTADKPLTVYEQGTIQGVIDGGLTYTIGDSTTDWQEVTLTGEVTSNIDNYINAGNVTVLVEQNSVHQSGCASNIETDYVKLVVTP